MKSLSFKNKLLFFLGILISKNIHALPTWMQNEPVPINGRANILEHQAEDFYKYKRQGQLHAQIYPVTVTGLLPPYEATKNFIEGDLDNPLRKILSGVVSEISDLRSFDQTLENLGLHPYPLETDTGLYQVPYPNNQRPPYRMGFGVLKRFNSQGFTFSCSACHSGQLFGKTVLGLTNRFPKANEFFVNAKKLAPFVDLWLFKSVTGASKGEVQLMEEVKNNVKRVGVLSPIQLGLDTSLAQVALSLNRRNDDQYATPSERYQVFPRRDPILDSEPADSKPAVWWNVKYKNRWLSDGSVLSGNPIFTNIIWNEIGRGVDLKILEQWLSSNSQVVDELTTAVFSSEAPHITDFFPAEVLEENKVRAGEKIFNQTCSRCHGVYEKAWNLPNASSLSWKEQLKTVRVIPKTQTPVKDVGTDRYRYQGMKSLESLNQLSISKKNNIVIQAQSGYVPPPLVGIWARWPYLHNNSIPDLCTLLTRSELRVKKYYAGEAVDKKSDFDLSCNGYPKLEQVPLAWKKPEYLYDTSRKGMSAVGHDEGIFLEGGKELLSLEDKMNLIQFLQTL